MWVCQRFWRPLKLSFPRLPTFTVSTLPMYPPLAAVTAEPTGENWGSVLAQDFGNMEFVQKGMKSSGFRGPMPNPHQEQKVINLHRNLAEYMGMSVPRLFDGKWEK